MTDLLEVKELRKHFIQGSLRHKIVVKAVDGVDLSIRDRSTHGLVGESGCGKTTIARLILRLIEPTSGQVAFDGHNILLLGKREMIEQRRHMQIVFQDPFSSLDPRMTVERIVAEPLVTHTTAKGSKLRAKVQHLLEVVGLQPDHLNRYPHEFSGGQRQRIAIARAIALNPKFLILDEPTSSLDVSVQAQILNLLREIQKSNGMTYLFISHNLNVVRYMSDYISVMYLGKVVEDGSVTEVFENPEHPYTKGLIAAVPTAKIRAKREDVVVAGDIPSPAHPPSGCRFHTRCSFAFELCRREEPRSIRKQGNHLVACHLVEE